MDASVCAYFWVREEEPPGGTSLIARRHMATTQIFWVFVKLTGGDEQPPGDTNHFWHDFGVLRNLR